MKSSAVWKRRRKLLDNLDQAMQAVVNTTRAVSGAVRLAVGNAAVDDAKLDHVHLRGYHFKSKYCNHVVSAAGLLYSQPKFLNQTLASLGKESE